LWLRATKSVLAAPGTRVAAWLRLGNNPRVRIADEDGKPIEKVYLALTDSEAKQLHDFLEQLMDSAGKSFHAHVVDDRFGSTTNRNASKTRSRSTALTTIRLSFRCSAALSEAVAASAGFAGARPLRLGFEGAV
jgi:hypothetical protein